MQRITCPLIIATVALPLLAAGPVGAALVGLYRFEGNTLDSSGNGNHGTIQNPTGSAFSASTPQMTAGQSLLLDTADEHVRVPHSASLNITGQMTIAAWVNPGPLGSFEGVIAKNPSVGSGNNHAGNYELRAESNRSLNFLYQRGGLNDTVSDSSGTNRYVPNSWTHIAVTADGANARFYIDGVLVATDPMTAGFGATNTNPLYIGTRADLFTDFAGRMDDVAIFNNVLTLAEINTIKRGDFSGYGVGTPMDLLPIPIFNTGVSAGNAVLAAGSQDPHWTITATPAGPAFGPALAQSNHSAWLVNDPAGTIGGSSWISVVSAGTTGIAPGTYRFETTFDLAGLNPDTAVLVLEIASDDTVTNVLLNGVSTGIVSLAGFGALNGPFTIDSGFQFGTNTLTFQLANGGTTANPGGLRINFLQAFASAIPEPATASLLLLTAGGMMVRRRRPAAA